MWRGWLMTVFDYIYFFGMPLAYIINKLKDIKCGFKDASCPQEIAKALLEFKKNNL